MWQPEPGWHPLPGGTGPSTVGVWRTVLGDQAVVVKRLAAPREHDPAELSDPHHFAFWRRPADVATSGAVDTTPGLRAPLTAVDEDDDGITLTQQWVEDAANSGLFAAHALGRFAGSDLGARPWLARDQLRDRIQQRSGGRVNPEQWTHGSAAERVKWFRTGFTQGSLDACDTFAANAL